MSFAECKLNINSKKVYIIDYLNIWSDFRELKYKHENIDYKTRIHKSKVADTYEFFDFFFNKYIKEIQISKINSFIFVLKKITNYDITLMKMLERYNDININFVIIESRYSEKLLDKNKDDFICQYLLSNNLKHDLNLISTDRYKDLKLYEKKFNNILISVLNMNNNKISSEIFNLELSNQNVKIGNKLNRVFVPKTTLMKII